MAATDRSGSPSSRRPAARILGAVFAGSAVMFAMTALQDGSPTAVGDGPGPVAGPLLGEPARPSPEVAAAPRGDSPLTSGNEVAAGTILLSDQTAAGPPSTRSDALDAPPPAPDATDDQGQIAGLAPGTTVPWETPAGWETPDREARLRELAARRASTQAASAPATPTQRPPAADDNGQNPPAADDNDGQRADHQPTDQPDHGVLRDLLDHLGAERGH